MLHPRLLPADTGSSSAGVLQLALLALPLIMVVVVLVLSRRRQRDAEARAAAVQVGDEVVTASGMIGRVVSLDDEIARLEVAPGVVTAFHRRAVVSAIEPVSPLAGGSGTSHPAHPVAGLRADGQTKEQ